MCAAIGELVIQNADLPRIVSYVNSSTLQSLKPNQLNALEVVALNDDISSAGETQASPVARGLDISDPIVYDVLNIMIQLVLLHEHCVRCLDWVQLILRKAEEAVALEIEEGIEGARVIADSGVIKLNSRAYELS